MFDFTIAFRTLIALVSFLFILFFFLLGYTFWTRLTKNYWERYEKKFRSYFFSLILDYAEQTSPKQDADDIIKQLSRRTKDYAFFLRLLNKLVNILDGEDRERLNDFIEHPAFLSLFQERLFDYSTNSKLLACRYFRFAEDIDQRTLAKLISMSRTSNIKLAYAATKAIITSGKPTIQKTTLLRFFKRSDFSELMVPELLYLLDPGNTAYRPQIGRVLKSLLIENIGQTAKIVIIRYLGCQRFYKQSNFLFQYLKRLQYNNAKAPLIQALIIALGQLHNINASSVIRAYTQKGMPTDIRLAGVKTLSTLGGEKNLIFLVNNLQNAEFAVRKAIIEEFILNDKKRLEYLLQYVISNLDLIRKIKDQKQPPKHIYPFLDKIDSIAAGIQITLSHRLMNTNA
ncbi:hypothetical protein LX73_1112 [Fodinibius salinus]|uniref:HEAT repeat-containing protein n=1 Tax=Fodinibius salinus TaxID=860790 RepID=A0A5D3YIS9_9BACT|nr:hypothetical protein [Fodinibius salinus]TYP93408.1 hypothetical protein LX73_1112 [Fodinibius salinus]